GATHRFLVDAIARKNTACTKHRRVIVVPFSERLGTVFVRQIHAILYRQWREIAKHAIPLGISSESQSLAPSLCDFESVRPVRKFKRRIPRLCGRMILLCRNYRWSEHVARRLRVEVRIVSHELSRLKHKLTILLQRATSRA